MRITMSKFRAEILQLETLENIAACFAPTRPPSRTDSDRPGARAARAAEAVRLDVFRAVSFARKLAENLAEHGILKS